MNSRLENALFELYKDEINIENFRSYNTLLKTIILYKNLASIDSYFYENKFDIVVAEDGRSLPENIKNSIVIGGVPYMDDDHINQMITAFINRNIEDEADRYAIYINEDDRVVHITKVNHSYGYSVFNSSIEKVFCAIITKAVPWYFGDLPTEIFQEYAPLFIDNNGYQQFDQKFEAYIEESGLKEKIYMEQMANLAVKITEKKKRALEQELSVNNDRIQDYFRRIFELNGKVKEQQATIKAIELQGEDYKSPVNELVEFIGMCKEKITIEEVYDETIKFKFITAFEHYDEYESNIKTNPGTSFYFGKGIDFDGSNPFEKYSTDQIKHFYKLLMEDKELKAYGCGFLELNIVTGHPNAMSCERMDNAMPHPHLSQHNCFGSARDAIMQYAISNRYAEALNQVLYSMKQLTLPDSAANKYFVKGLVKNKCIECPDGVLRNFDETMKYLTK